MPGSARQSLSHLFQLCKLTFLLLFRHQADAIDAADFYTSGGSLLLYTSRALMCSSRAGVVLSVYTSHRGGKQARKSPSVGSLLNS